MKCLLNSCGSIHCVLKARQRKAKTRQNEKKIVFGEKVIKLRAGEVSRTEEFM